MTVGIRLLDGRVLSAETWEQVEDTWAGFFMNATIPRDEFRAEIERRAHIWSGVEIAADGDSRDFLLECERAGLLTTISNADSSETRDEKRVTLPRLVYLEAQRLVREARELRNQAAQAGEGN